MSGLRLVRLAVFAASVPLSAAASASAAVIASYGFGTTSAPTVAPTSKDANVTATPVGGGNQTININQNGSNYTTFPFRAVSKSAAAGQTSAAGTVTGAPTLSTDRSQFFIEYTVAAAAGYELDLTSVTFDGAQGGGTAGDRQYAIHTSVDGLGLTNNGDITSGGYVATTNGTNAFTVVRPGTGSIAMPTFTADLSAAKYQDLSSFTFRLYFATVNNGQNLDIDNLVLNGTVAAVPEPTTLAAVAGGAVALLHRRRRRA